VLVLRIEDNSPKLGRLTFNKVASLHSIQVVAVSNLDKFLIAGAPCSLVSSESEVRISLLAVFTDDFAVIVLILDQEVLNILVAWVDINLSQSVVKSWLDNSVLVAGLKPNSEKSKFATIIEFFNKLVNRAHSDRVEELLNVVLVAVEVEEGSEHLGWSVGVYFENENLDTLELLGCVKVSGEIFDVAMHITQIDERTWITKFTFHKEILDFLGIIVLGFLDDAFNFFEITHSCARLNILEIKIGVVSVRQHIAQEEQESLVGTICFKDLNGLLGVDLGGILDGNFSD
jgi:hypothetical protein